MVLTVEVDQDKRQILWRIEALYYGDSRKLNVNYCLSFEIQNVVNKLDLCACQLKNYVLNYMTESGVLA